MWALVEFASAALVFTWVVGWLALGVIAVLLVMDVSNSCAEPGGLLGDKAESLAGWPGCVALSDSSARADATKLTARITEQKKNVGNADVKGREEAIKLQN